MGINPFSHRSITTRHIRHPTKENLHLKTPNPLFYFISPHVNVSLSLPFFPSHCTKLGPALPRNATNPEKNLRKTSPFLKPTNPDASLALKSSAGGACFVPYICLKSCCSTGLVVYKKKLFGS